MQKQKDSLNEKIFFKSENLKIVRYIISKFTQRIRNWFNKELSPSQELPHEFKELDTQQEYLRARDIWHRYF